MAKVLTIDSTVTCSHPDGTVPLGDKAKLRFGTTPVLVKSSVVNILFGPCGNNQSPNTPCTKVTEITDGLAAKLRVGNDPVLLEGLKGKTNGTIPDLLPVVAEQAKLTAQ